MPTIADVRSQYPQYGDLSDGELAGALHRKFYSDLPLDEFNRRIGLTAPEQGPQPSRGDAIGRSLANAITFNLADEAVASARAGSPYAGFGDRMAGGLETIEQYVPEWLLGSSEHRQRAKDLMRGQQQEFDTIHAQEDAATGAAQEAYPNTALAASVGGGLATGLGMANKGLTLLNAAKPTVWNMAARGAAEGGLYGAAYGFGAGDGLGDRLMGAATGAAVSAPLGGVLGGAGGALAQRAVTKGALKAAPSIDDLKNQAHALYDTAKRSGVVIRPDVYRGAVKGVAQAVRGAGFHPRIHPKVGVALTEFARAAKRPVDLGLVDRLRRITGSAAKSIEPDERRIASIMIDKVDDLVSALGPADVIGPDPRIATKAITAARKLWAMSRKADAIEELVQRAQDSQSQFSQAGLENALRVQFRAFVKNPKKMRGFTPAEQKALRKVSNGGVIRDLLRDIGKLSPSGGTIPLAGHLLTAVMTGGASLPITAASMTAGGLARIGAREGTSNAVDLAQALVRSGGRLPAAAPPLSATRRSLIDAILAGQAAGAN